MTSSALGVASRRPGRRPATLAVLFALGAALSGFTILRGIEPHDEGLMLQWSARIAHGEWPYRDFWINYGPGQPLLLGGLWKALGPSLLVWRIVRTAIDATIGVLAFSIVRRDAPGRLAFGAWAAVAGAMAFPTGPGPNPPALALVLGAMLLVTRSPAGAGALCGVAAVFRPELGVAGAIAVALRGGGARSAAVAAGVAVLGYLPFFVVAPGDLLSDTFGFLAVQHLQRLPLPTRYAAGLDPEKLIEFLIPWILLAGAALWGVAAGVRGRRDALPWLALIAVGLLYLVGRPDEFHLVPLAPVLAIALALLAAREPRPVVRIALLVALALIAIHGLERRAGQLRHPLALAAVPSPIADGVKTDPADARSLRGLLGALRALPRGPILVAPPHFDQVTVGDPLLYVLAGRRNPTRFDVMQPGVVTTASNQREMIADLERAPPRAVVRWLDPRAQRREPDAGGREHGSHLLDDWLRAHYGAPRRFGVYVLLSPRSRSRSS